ncbi:MAG: indolepyruvate ferredoxin oxidoreductase subunit beta [Chloroflexi bacterium]|nr:indolepyruvate ferredoxin oxidoreductase subunit beta [Chloroflexota bacterium]
MSELLGNAAVKDGLRVRGSEVLGMAVRGGSVVSTVRIGDEVYGPLIPTGKSDILVGMEPAEALRNIAYLSKSGLVILNTRRIIPYTVPLGQSRYPSLEKIIEQLGKVAQKIITLNAAQIAEEAGSTLSANIVMLGAVFGAGKLPIKSGTIKGAIRARFSAKLAPVNLKAFDLGYQKCRQALKRGV